jgi:hypothetical protein
VCVCVCVCVSVCVCVFVCVCLCVCGNSTLTSMAVMRNLDCAVKYFVCTNRVPKSRVLYKIKRNKVL